MPTTTKGIIFGIIAAVCYGTNPLGALYLQQEGINTPTVVFFRYLTAVIMIAAIMAATKRNFRVSKEEFLLTAFLGIFFGASSLTLYESFNYMDAGVASTILFCYPVMVSVIMTAFFHERITVATVLSLVLALTGILLLSKGGAGSRVSLTGVVLVILSSLTYAVYIVAVNRAKITTEVFKMTFYVMIFATVMIAMFAFFGTDNHLQMLRSGKSWFWAAFLGLLPTVVSLVFMNKAIKLVGSTPAAITGAVEPVTAVIIGVFVFDEPFTVKLLAGIVLILSAVMLIILTKKPAEE